MRDKVKEIKYKVKNWPKWRHADLLFHRAACVVFEIRLSSRKERRTKGQEVGIYIMRTPDDTSLDEYPIRGATVDSITDKLLIVSHGDHCVFRMKFNDSFHDKKYSGLTITQSTAS
jgi:hypothetical protein